MFEKDLVDEFSPFLGLIVDIRSEKHDLPLYGRVKAVSPDFVTIERKDGRLVHHNASFKSYKRSRI